MEKNSSMESGFERTLVTVLQTASEPDRGEPRRAVPSWTLFLSGALVATAVRFALSDSKFHRSRHNRSKR